MKKQFLAIALLAGCLYNASAQQVQENATTTYSKEKLTKTELQALVGYYAQEGNNSAVTGGVGSEELSVFSVQSSGKIDHNQHEFSYHLGIDVITSVSTDKIDFVQSSPSYQDFHFSSKVGYARRLNPQWQLGIHASYTQESDYLGIPLGVSLLYKDPVKIRVISTSLNISFDDLLWGWGNGLPQEKWRLVYPQELRGVESLDRHHRNTFHLRTAYHQTIHQRLVLGGAVEAVYQQGVLSTPFHRVYFSDGSVHLERLPSERFKLPLSMFAHYFLGGRHLLKGKYNYYIDSWGIVSHGLQADYTIKIDPKWSISTVLRWHTQQATQYFKPSMEHMENSNYHTSDYDLSSMDTYKLSIEIQVRPTSYNGISNIGIRYAYYQTSNHLIAHMISVRLALSKQKKRR